MASEDDDNTTQQNTTEEKPAVETLQIVVRSQDGAELQFKIKRSTPLIKVFTAYCSRKGLAMGDCRFMYEGQLLASGNVTPEEMNIEDGDIIDCMASQVGGWANVACPSHSHCSHTL